MTGALAVGAAAAGSATSSSGAGGGVAGGVAASKLVALGALLGSAATIGIAALVLGFGAPSELAPEGAPRPAGAAVDSIELRSRAGSESVEAPRAQADSPAPGAAPATKPAPVVSSEDELVREAKLVAEARGALRRGDASRALAAAKAARAIPRAQLEPESLSVEIGALRALGRDGEAISAELEMRRKYPDHALSR